MGMESHLAQHPDLRDDTTLIVLQLPPTRDRLPIQIVVFTKTLETVDYERMQADLFDRIIAILPEFRLRAFQRPRSQHDICVS